MYEYHDDDSGVMLSSRRRPILNLKPGADGWAFTADTNLVAYLTQLGRAFDVLTDEDLHHEGRALLDDYRIVRHRHPPRVLVDRHARRPRRLAARRRPAALPGRQRLLLAGRLERDEPWVMEVRRAEDGTRGWIAEPGEYYHELRRGVRRPVAAARSGARTCSSASVSPPRASTGLPPTGAPGRHRRPGGVDLRRRRERRVVGDYGVGGGAAGQEIDRYDPALGSPAHAVVLATSFDHSEQMLRTKEEFLATAMIPDDPKIRADVVFFEGPEGGAVFSVGSISWYGALAHDGYDNDIARITTNVMRRFLDPRPF